MDVRCRKHPEHRQSVGVCPFCLGERLSQLSASSSSSSSATTTTISSPNCSQVPPLKKSRSLALAIGGPRGEGQGKQDKGGGFWSKLVIGTSKRKEKQTLVL